MACKPHKQRKSRHYHGTLQGKEGTLTGMVSKGAACPRNEPLFSAVDCHHPQPVVIVCIEHTHTLTFAHIHLILLFGLKVVDDNKFFNVTFSERVNWRLDGDRSIVGEGSVDT